MPPSSPLFSLRLQISSSVFHFCLYPWCIKLRDSSTHFKLIFILPGSTSWKPSLMHYPGVSREPLCFFPLPGTLVVLMPKRTVLLPSQDSTATINFLDVTFSPGLQFFSPPTQKYSKGMNIHSFWMYIPTLTICSGIATEDDADRMVTWAHHSGGQGQCQPVPSCVSLAVRAPSLSSGHLCNSLQSDFLETAEHLKCVPTTYTHIASWHTQNLSRI